MPPTGPRLPQRLDALAATVCEHDPRSQGQRRADACGALGRGEATLACQCGREDCTAGASQRGRGVIAVIHVLAEQAPSTGTSDDAGVSAGVRDPARRIRTAGGQDRDAQAADRADRVRRRIRGIGPSAKNKEFIGGGI